MADWVCGKCRSINNPGATSCYSCATPRYLAEASVEQLAAPAGQAGGFGGSDRDARAFGGSASEVAGYGQQAEAVMGAAFPSSGGLSTAAAMPQATSEAYAPALPQRPANLVGGLLAGTVAAVVATLVWYGVVVMTEYQVGFVAAGIGWLVGFAIVFGAGGRASIPLVAASAVLSLLALGISEYLIQFHFAAQFLGFELTFADLIQPLGFVLEVIIESLQNEPVTLVFWAIALFGAVSVPFRSMSPQEN